MGWSCRFSQGAAGWMLVCLLGFSMGAFGAPGVGYAQGEDECGAEAPDSDGDGRADCADHESSEHPAVGAVLRTLAAGLPTGSTECTGTLVGCGTVLTSASCVCHADGEGCQAGSADAPNPLEFSVFFHGHGRFQVEQIDIHPDFSGAPDFAADLALLHLQGDVSGLAPLRLSRGGRPAAGADVEHFGFGAQTGAGAVRAAHGVKRAIPATVNRDDCPSSDVLCTEDSASAAHPASEFGSLGAALFRAGQSDFLGVATGASADSAGLGQYARYDRWLYFYRKLLSSQMCGDAETVPETRTEQGYFPIEGTRLVAHTIEVPAETAALRVTLVGEETGLLTDLDITAQPGLGAVQCSGDEIGPYDECFVEDPVPGLWVLAVQRKAGFGNYQLSTALYPQFEPDDPPPTDLYLETPRGPVLIGATSELYGAGFTAGSVVKVFVRTAEGIVGYGPYTPTEQSGDRLSWSVPAEILTGSGFVSLQIVNTDQEFLGSNVVSAFLSGSPSAGYPQILVVNGEGLGEVSPTIPMNYVEVALIPGEVVTLEGSGFSTPVVDVFTTDGKIGPITPLSGSTDRVLSFELPAEAAVGSAALRVVNKGQNFLASNAVALAIGAQIRLDSVTQSGTTITVDGDGFCPDTVINLFNRGTGGLQNFGGRNPDGTPRILLTVESGNRFSFELPAGAQAGKAYVQALNPPFIPFSSTGNSPAGAFTIATP